MNSTPATDTRSFGRHLRLAATLPHDPQRHELESYVRAAFARKHSADVQSFMPTLLAFRDASASLCGVVGLRAASHSSLYLERYLDKPVESGRSRPRPPRPCAATRSSKSAISPAATAAPQCAWSRSCRHTCSRTTIAGSCSRRRARCARSCSASARRSSSSRRAERSRVAGGRDDWGTLLRDRSQGVRRLPARQPADCRLRRGWARSLTRCATALLERADRRRRARRRRATRDVSRPARGIVGRRHLARELGRPALRAAGRQRRAVGPCRSRAALAGPALGAAAGLLHGRADVARARRRRHRRAS